MQEGYIELQCAGCQETWEETVGTLPDTDEDFECPHCGRADTMAAFARTDTDLEVLEAFHR